MIQKIQKKTFTSLIQTNSKRKKVVLDKNLCKTCIPCANCSHCKRISLDHEQKYSLDCHFNYKNLEFEEIANLSYFCNYYITNIEL